MSEDVVKGYPFMSPAEFKAACSAFTNRALHLSQHRALNNVHVYEQNEESALSLRKQLPLRASDSIGEDTATGDQDDDADIEALSRPVKAMLTLDFWITLSPTYQCPILWFNFSSPLPGTLQGFDAIYEYLVPEHQRPELQAVGNIGGISMANDPINDLPAYFIHPCNTPAALSELGEGKAVSPLEYLLLWLGLVGPSVGLYVPSELLEQRTV